MTMFNFIKWALFCWLAFGWLSAAQPTDYKSGISLTLGGTEGVDWKHEQPWHDAVTYDIPTIYLRDTTEITLTHNARNVRVRDVSQSRDLYIVGANGLDGVADTGDEGTIRWAVDEYWSNKKWKGDVNSYRQYYGPLTLAGMRYFNDATSAYDAEGPLVVGTVGHNNGTITTLGARYWYGLNDAAGDEYHILRYADDDSSSAGNVEANASDGKYAILCVNPKTPNLHIETTSGTGQFYTTPAWTYHVPLIHAQTSYINSDTQIILTDIYAANISYRINGGSWTTGAGPVTISSSAFSTGPNTLEYKAIRGTEPVKTRTVVKNPTHPSLAESHGNFLWENGAGRTAAIAKVGRTPFKATFDANATKSNTNHDSWIARGRLGYRFGSSIEVWIPGVGNVQGPNSTALRNAFNAVVKGWSTVVPTGTYTYARLAKEMMMDGITTIPLAGIESAILNSNGPAIDLWYRGYRDVNGFYNVIFTYDIIAGEYRSDQHAEGMTPIEDYYMRDQIASLVHMMALQTAGHKGTATGLWVTSWKVGAMVATMVMPKYSTPYFGTSGFDGITTTAYQYVPFVTDLLTWKDMFVDADYTIGVYPYSPVQGFGMVGEPDNSARWIQGNGTLWGNAKNYFNLCQRHISIFWTYQRMYNPSKNLDEMYTFIENVSLGGIVLPTQSTQSYIQWNLGSSLNADHPDAATIMIPLSRQPGAINGISEASMINDYTTFAYATYDDLFNPETPLPTIPNAPSGLTANAISNSTVALSWTDNSANETYFEVQRSLDNSTWTSSVQTAANATSYNSVGLTGGTLYYYRVRAGNETGVSAWVSASDTTDPDEVVPPPPTVNKRKPKGSGAAGAGGPL